MSVVSFPVDKALIACLQTAERLSGILRKRELGLRRALLRQDDGYLLDPTIRIVLADRREESDRPSLAS